MGSLRWYVIELPWRNNQNKISCIPAGEYTCVIHHSVKYGRIWMLTNVEGRSYILIHSGNFAGDVNKGWQSHSQGCLIIGAKLGTINKQRAVLSSKISLVKFHAHTKDLTTFPFTIIDAAEAA
jgi:hypothetical protein